MGDLIIINKILAIITTSASFCFFIYDYNFSFDTNLKNDLNINKDVYLFYKKSKYFYLNFTFEEFCNKTKNGFENLEVLRLEEIQIFKDKFLIKNNLYNNFSCFEKKNLLYYQELKYVYSDYIFNNMIYKNNLFLFNVNGKINYRLIFERNFLPYNFEPYYLKNIFFLKKLSSNIIF